MSHYWSSVMFIAGFWLGRYLTLQKVDAALDELRDTLEEIGKR